MFKKTVFRAKDIIHCHKNPVKQNASFGQKIFTPENTENEKTEVKKSLENLKDILIFPRVERRYNQNLPTLVNMP